MSGGPQGSDVLVRAAGRIGHWLSAIPAWALAVLLLAFGLLRTSILPIGPEWVGWLRSSGESLPQPSQYLSSSVGPSTLMRLLGCPNSVTCWALGALLWLLVFAVPVALVARRGVRGRLIAFAIAASPAFAVTATMIGHYDLWIIAGSCVVVLARRWWLGLLGALVAVLGNPEQAAPSAFAILLVAVAWRNRSLLIRSLIYLGLAISAFALVALWASAADAASRSGAYLSLLPLSVQSFLGVWPLAMYAWLGPLWIVVIAIVAALPRWSSRSLVVAGVVLLPGFMSITTLDGTRVFVAVGTGALVAAFSLALQGPWRDWEPPEVMLAVGGAALVFMPSIIIDTAGGIRLPYADWLAQLKARWP